ncbi:MAG: hypothetical protein P4L46_15295 [Fimbriimonas sp.]|nr:hypothetical protein [Fimbriimonas sp.]
MEIDRNPEQLSRNAVELLESILRSAPVPPSMPPIGLHEVVGYVAGVLSPNDAERLESEAIVDLGLRQGLVQASAHVERLKRTPYHELLSAGIDEDPVRNIWLSIIDDHVHLLSKHLKGAPPTKWPSLAAMGGDGAKGLNAFKTIWRSLFTQPIRGRAADGLLKLGFGYRRSASEIVSESTRIELESAWTQDSANPIMECTGSVLANGDLEISAIVTPDCEATSIFVSFSMHGRTLALTDGELVRGRARVLLPGLGAFLHIESGPVQVGSLSASVVGWPVQCEIGQIVVESGPRRAPYLAMPVVRDGALELVGYFEETHSGGKWELSLAVTPNSWQLLRLFDIKKEIERPQVLTAALPKTAMEGPFGGALLLKRIGPSVV